MDAEKGTTPTPLRQAVVHSSHGNIYIDESGAVLRIEHFAFEQTPKDLPEAERLAMLDDEDRESWESFHEIERFDIEEYKQWWGEDFAESFDIMDLGYTVKNNTYVEADSDWRNMSKNEMGTHLRGAHNKPSDWQVRTFQ
jgi:hypothetical protein